MASSGGVTTYTIDDGTYFYCNWQQASQDTANNRTLINYQYGVYCRYNYYSNAIRMDYVNINGSQVKGSETYSNLGQGTHQLGANSMWISHNADGNKTFNINLSGWAIGAGTATGSQNFTLNKINRYAVTNSATGNNIEENFSVNYTKYVSTYKYKLRISIPNVRELEKIDYNTSGTSFTLSKQTIDDLYNIYGPLSTFNLGFAVETWDSTGTNKLSDGNEKILSCSTDSKGRIRINGVWENATPYIRVNGEWKRAIPHIRINNEWKRGK